MLTELLGTHADFVLTIVRITLGVVLFEHGAQKLLGWYGGPGFANTKRAFTEQLHLPGFVVFLVTTSEFFGGLGLIVGLLSRIAALGVITTMLGAMRFHFQHGLFMNWFGEKKGHGYEYHLLAIALAIVVFVKGAGAVSADRALYRHYEARSSMAARSEWR